MVEPNDQPPAVTKQALVDPVGQDANRMQAAQHGGQGVMAFHEYIQQGPIGISMLCFIGGLGTSVLGLMNVCNVFGTVIDPFHYILNAYMLACGMVTAVIEAEPDKLGMFMTPFDQLAAPVTRAQAWLHRECRLLTELRGRGFFYLYQGTLMATQCVFCLIFINGVYNCLIGLLCIMISYSVKQDTEGMAASAGMGHMQYQRLDTEACAEEGVDPAAATENSAVAVAAFAQAEAAWKRKKTKLPGKASRELWAMHRQATTGDCTEPKPSGIFNGNAKEQWRLWSGLKGMSQEEAKIMFMERLRRDKVPM